MLDLIGWLGAFSFAICAVPQAYESIKNKNSDGIAPMFLTLWLQGEILMLIYVAFQPELDYPLFINYLFNLILTSVIAFYKIFPNKTRNV